MVGTGQDQFGTGPISGVYLPESAGRTPSQVLSSGSMAFRIELDTYRGPLDLLLYLVRRHEVAVSQLSLAEIAQQFLDHLEVVEQLDLDTAGEFLEVAGQLVEIKSRTVLPRVEEPAEATTTEEHELVRRLLEYKEYRDAATSLDERSRDWQRQSPRLADDAPRVPVDPATQPIREIELWDLVSAVTRILREARSLEPPSIVYDDTPIDAHMERIRAILRERGRVAFSELLQSGTHKSAVIGIFLAMLELVRHHDIIAEQPDGQNEIWILAAPKVDENEQLPADAPETT